LKNNGAKWDIIGMSIYPYWAKLDWQTVDSLALINMKDMIARYNTKVMVVEAGYLYNLPIEANHFLIDLIEKTKSVGGLSVFYWEPESNPQKFPSSPYNLGAWDPVTNQPTVALDAFLGNYITSVIEEKKILDYDLKIYPNPFNPSATIKYSLSKQSHVTLSVYNMLGEQVKILLDDLEDSGEHSIMWNGTSNFGMHVSSGIYLIRLNIEGNNQVHKVVLLR